MSFPSLLHFADKTSFRSTEWPPSNLRGYGRIIFMSMRNKRGICVYCGREKKLTMDHVPPKLLFASPYPPNLPTVPSCRDCNASFQKDDEYTRVVAAVDYRAAHHEDVKTKLPAIQRSLARPDAKAFADYLDSQTSPTKTLDLYGRPIANAIEVQQPRVNATGKRIIRGLYYVEAKKTLDLDARIKIGSKAGLDASDPMGLQFARVYRACSERRDRAIGETFSYVAGFGQGFSIWLMMLYGYFVWAGTTDSR